MNVIITKFHSALDLARQGNLAAADKVLDSILLTNKDHINSLLLKADIYLNCKKYAVARSLYLKALKLSNKKNDYRTLLSLAHCLEQLNDYDDARSIYQKCIKIAPDSIETNFFYAQLLISLGDILESKKYFSNVVNLFCSLQSVGEVERLYLASSEYSISNIKNSEHASSIERLSQYNKSQFSAKSCAQLYFSLGNHLDKVGEYQSAFQAYKTANEIMTEVTSYTSSQIEHQIELVEKYFPLTECRKVSLKEPTPIFIVGLPRSGTTLIESIFSPCKEVATLGEFELLPSLISQLEINGLRYPHLMQYSNKELLNRIATDYLSATNINVKSYFTDKLPSNFWNIGLILSVFPNAKIISCSKEGGAMEFSLFKQFFIEGHEYSYNIKRIRHYLNAYRKIMKLWKERYPNRVYDVVFHEFVSEPGTKAKEIYEYCGLNWSASYLEDLKFRDSIRTSSVTQIRDGVDSRYIAHWENYRKFIEST